MALPRNSNYTVYTALQASGASETVNSVAIVGLLADPNGDIVIAQGVTVPTDGSAGYAKGGIFLKTDVVTGTGGTYLNKGTNLASAFTLATQA